MKRTLALVLIVLALILNACAPALPAQSATNSQSPTSTPAIQKTEQFQPQGSTPAVKMVALESSLLVAGWDSKEREYRLYPIHPESGEPLAGYAPIPVGGQFYHAIAPDRNRLAFIVFRSSENPVGGSLLLVDVGRWSAQTLPLELDGMVTALGFNPNGRRLALAIGSEASQVVIVDLDQQAIIASTGLDILASRLKYTADGDAVFVYGTPVKNRFTVNESAVGPPQAILLDGQDASLRWSAELVGVRDGIYPKEGSPDETIDLHQPGAAVYDLPGVVFAPNRDALYVVHSGMDALTTVDYASQKVETREILPALSWFERLLWLTARPAKAKIAEGASLRAQVSPDGELIYVVGSKQELVESKPAETMYELTPYGLQVIRVADGTVLDHMDTQANDLTMSIEGDYLYLHTWKERGSETQVVSTEGLKVINGLEGTLAPVLRENGAALLASTEWISSVRSRMSIVDPESLSVLAEWSGPHAIFLGTP